jgi:hypothetical protein
VPTAAQRNDLAAFLGRFGSDGDLGMSWYSGGRQRMIGILIAERPWTSPSPPHVCLNFWSSASQVNDEEKISVDVSMPNSLARL